MLPAIKSRPSDHLTSQGGMFGYVSEFPRTSCRSAVNDGQIEMDLMRDLRYIQLPRKFLETTALTRLPLYDPSPPLSVVNSMCFLTSASVTVFRLTSIAFLKSAKPNLGSKRASPSTSVHARSIAPGAPGEHGVSLRMVMVGSSGEGDSTCGGERGVS